MKLEEYRNQLEKSKEYTTAKKDLKLNFALADAVLEARIKKGWTQKELAKAIGTKQANISRIESGLANPTLEFISRLTTVLDFELKFSCENNMAVEFAYEPMRESSRDNFFSSGVAFPINGLDYDISANQSKTQGKKAYAC